MGVRTLHQQEAKAQLVVEIQRGEGCLAVAALEQGVDASLLERALAGGQQVGGGPEKAWHWGGCAGQLHGRQGGCKC